MADATTKTLDLSTLTDVEREILKTAILLPRDATAARVKPAVRQHVKVKDIPQALNGLAKKGWLKKVGDLQLSDDRIRYTFEAQAWVRTAALLDDAAIEAAGSLRDPADERYERDGGFFPLFVYDLLLKAVSRLQRGETLDGLEESFRRIEDTDVFGLGCVFSDIFDVCVKDERLQSLFWAMGERARLGYERDMAVRLDYCRRLTLDMDEEATDFWSRLCGPCVLTDLRAFHNRIWLSDDPWGFVAGMRDDWRRTLMRAVSLLVRRKDPAKALKTARDALRTLGEKKQFNYLLANWFYGLILYANRENAAVRRTLRSLADETSHMDFAGNMPVRLWAHIALSDDVSRYLTPARLADWKLADDVRALIGLTLIATGHAQGMPLADEAKAAWEAGRLKGLLAFEACRIFNPDSSECREMARKLGFDGFLPEAVRPVPAWERVIDKMILAQGGALPVAAKTARERIVYHLSLVNLTVKPRLQKSKDGIVWSKGRDMALGTFKNYESEDLTAQDKRIASLVMQHRCGSDQWAELGGGEVVNALVGHRAVYDADRPSQRLEVVRQPFTLTVRREASGFVLSSDMGTCLSPSDCYLVMRPSENVVSVVPVDGSVRSVMSDLLPLGTLPLSAAPKLKVLLEKLSDRMQVVSDLIDEVG